MDSDEEIEAFYKNWLSINRPQNRQESQSSQSHQTLDDSASALSHIIYENNTFQLYVEKGKKYIIKVNK
jgi:hypothetical protein